MNIDRMYESEVNMKYKTDVVYRCIGEEMRNGIVACGFMKKETAERSQYDFMNDFYSCFILLQGSGEYITEDGELIILEKGDLVQRVPGVAHTTKVDPDGKWLEFFFSVGADFFFTEKNLGVLSQEPVKKGVFPSVSIEHYDKLISKLRAATQKELPMIALELQREILYLFGYGTTQGAKLSTDSWLQMAGDRLSKDLDENISMEHLAEELNIGYESFRKEFKKEFGVSPKKYRIEKKMEQACMLLKSGIPIKEIAKMVGYEDAFSFSKQFTRTKGISPGKYRK